MSIQQRFKSQRIASFGFSLVELMITVAVITILAAIAVASYTKSVVKTNRSAATACLSEYANYMERYYTSNLRYDQAPASSGTAAPVANPVLGATPTLVLDCASTAQTGNNYQYQVPAASATAYTVQATPINAQLTRDTQCGTLTLNQRGSRTDSGTGTVTQCWGG
ncbi:MAG TPA: type IV pilin protein [Candidatus Saccharimonadales bacterium]|nr:type IV pilin protein [Candidatus Saccharimonadales bacterium]